MKIYEILSETPLQSFDFDGDPNATINSGNGAFQKRDLEKIKNPNFGKKLENFFKKTPFNFRLFFVNRANFGNYAQIDNDNSREISGYDLSNFWDMSDNTSHLLINKIIQDRKNAITIIYSGNAEKLNGTIADNVHSLSPWIVAHRIGHALDDFESSSGNMNDFVTDLFTLMHNLIENIYNIEFDEADIDDPFIQIVHTIGTQKSSVKGQLSVNHTEFAQELLAQYLNSGKVTLNQFPKFIMLDGQQHPANSNMNTASKKIKEFAEKSFNMILNAAVGKFFII